MSETNPYERFQPDAVRSITRDFHEDPSGRFLLVIPTGGGKTFTAVKAVAALIADGYFESQDDRVLWVAHRRELLDQALATFARFDDENGAQTSERIDFVMSGKVGEALAEGHPFRLAVIDEAHHAAAASYQPIFEDPRQLGVLGLTATPSRHDGRNLDFSKESFSIGFPDLIELGVLVRPEIVRVESGVTLNISSLDDDSLEELDNDERNGAIVAALRERAGDCQKAVVFVGTVRHAQNLYKLLRHSLRDSEYEFVGQIAGNKQSTFHFETEVEETLDREAFITRLKASKRSVVVNVDVLTEGYDDPSIDSVVMARPTNSKLVYMQAAGRAVRLDPQNPSKSPIIFEVEDDLPNIRYRVDNRWLFSEISDALEPAVVDVAYFGEEGKEKEVLQLCESYSVSPVHRPTPSDLASERLELLLFRYFDSSVNGHRHFPLVANAETRTTLLNLFNWLSAHMDRFVGVPFDKTYAAVRESGDHVEALQGDLARKIVLQAMENAFKALSAPPQLGNAGAPAPWITLVTLRKSRNALEPALEDFLTVMENASEIRTQLLDRDYASGDVLFRLPLPFRGYEGVILAHAAAEALDDTITRLKSHARTDIGEQWERREQLLSTPIPVAPRHAQYLPLLYRDSVPHKFPLTS
ncbi:DEAD/DEAH box helicase [bacterium]|nr:DEAD/DEAH box helicase [bacterium]